MSYFVTSGWRSWHKETGLQWLSLLLGDHNTTGGRERERVTTGGALPCAVGTQWLMSSPHTVHTTQYWLVHNCILHASETLKFCCLRILSKNTIIEKIYSLLIWERKAKVKVLQSSFIKFSQSCLEAKIIIDYFNYLLNVYADCWQLFCVFNCCGLILLSLRIQLNLN